MKNFAGIDSQALSTPAFLTRSHILDTETIDLRAS